MPPKATPATGTPVKTLRQREEELRALLATPEGREELSRLEARCRAEGAGERTARSSVVTYVLVHERSRGLICG
jgi:hypothetical protein